MSRGNAAHVGEVHRRPKARRPRFGLERQRDDAGIVLQPHADAGVVVARRVAVVDGDRRRRQAAVVGPAGQRNRDLVARVGEVEDRDVLVRFDDQQPPRAARKRERLRERQPLRAAAEAVQRVRDDHGGRRGLRQIQERQLVRVLDEGLAAVGIRVDDHPALFDRIDRDAAERIGQRRQLVALRADAVAAFDDGQRRLLVGLVVADWRAMAGRQDQQLVAVAATAARSGCAARRGRARCAGSGRRRAAAARPDRRARRGSRRRR